MDTAIKRFLEFNGRKVYFLNADGLWWIAIKPICEALGVRYERQRETLRRDLRNLQLPPLRGVVAPQTLPAEHAVIAADGKLRKMVCLPEFYIYGWLFKLRGRGRDFSAYQWRCYQVLYDHFHGAITDRHTALRSIAIARTTKRQLHRELLATEPKYQRMCDAIGVELTQNRFLRGQDRALLQEQLSLFEQTHN